ncbi:MAG: hypothetical protein ACWA5R_04625 [bacterium]
MLKLLQLYIDIAAMKKGPQAMPSYPVALWFSAIFYGLAVLANMAIDYELQKSFAYAIYALTFNSLFLYLLLQLFKKQQRFIQVLGAEFGVSAVITLAAMPTAYGLHLAELADQQPSGLLVISYIFILIWSLVVDGYIISQAIDKPRWLGFIVAVTAFIFSSFLARQLFA